MKPKHQGGYIGPHADLCERTLVTLLRGLGPWKHGIYLAGGLVPRYLIHEADNSAPITPHVGTTDVDLVLDLEVLAEVDAYRRLEQNLQDLGFERGANDEGRPQHYSWRKPIETGVVVVVDLLRDAPFEQGGKAQNIPNEQRLSALGIPGARLVIADYIEVPITAELLDQRGTATETIRVANIVPFVVLKAMAYEDRFEQKDAYDLIYCLENYGTGPANVADAFASYLRDYPDESLIPRAVEILRGRFATDSQTSGARKDGPTSYAQFLTDPGRTDLNARHRQTAAAAVELFLKQLNEASP